MDEWEKTLIETEQRSRSNTHRINDLEALQEDVRELTANLRMLASSVEQLVTGQRLQGERIGVLEKQPGEQWKLVVRTAVTAIVSALAGGAVGVFVMHMSK